MTDEPDPRADDPPARSRTDPEIERGRNRHEIDRENPDVSDLLTELAALEETVDAEHEQRKVRQTIDLVERMPGSRAFTRRVSKYTTRDIAESFVGSILISLPLLVEDGVYDIGDHFLAVTVGGVPVFLLANVAFIVLLSAGLMYYADFRDVDVQRILGIVPRRLLGVLAVSFITATTLMTMWGRVEGWEDPGVAFARISVIWTAAAFGAALGDILPGESEGPDIRDRFDSFTEAVGGGDD
ncbi:hypothetical protein AArcSl_1142 [Halalkaliarchaeum desulfuricum]|uniref:Integral membrane protein n=1 Tax=Halalkaliarchaeum desulfuricum TaxID=2055893 RepID=A0A343TI55_9EURY|nr:DUF2391 domain-containing protein [Halalkaliarchaeum desulfuricum]AUX08777.1 hypothetical protein AArcSl_1142 [Halalkaliarchaeum desulfuricum]